MDILHRCVRHSILMYLRQSSAKAIPTGGWKGPQGTNDWQRITRLSLFIFCFSFFHVFSVALLPPASCIPPDLDMMWDGMMGAVTQPPLRRLKPSRVLPTLLGDTVGHRFDGVLGINIRFGPVVRVLEQFFSKMSARPEGLQGKWNEKRRPSLFWQDALCLNDYTKPPCWHIIIKVLFFSWAKADVFSVLFWLILAYFFWNKLKWHYCWLGTCWASNLGSLANAQGFFTLLVPLFLHVHSRGCQRMLSFMFARGSQQDKRNIWTLS